MALGKIVSRFLRREEGAGPAKPARRSPLQDLEEGSVALEDVLRHRPEVLGSILHVISVGKIREILGEEWPVYAQKIYAIADRLFLRHLGPHGIYSIHEEDTFLFSFGADLRQAAEEETARAGEIATDLMRWLIGDSFAGAEIGVAALPVAEARQPDGGINVQAIAQAKGRARIIRAGDLDRAASGNGQATGAAVLSGQPADKPEWLPLTWPPEGLRLERDPCLAIPLPAGLRLGFRPVWQSRSAQTDLVLCEAIRVDPDGGPAKVLARPRDDTAAAALELAVLHAALRRMEGEIERRSGLSLVVPLSCSSIADNREALVAAIAESAPAGARGRHLFLELRALASHGAGGGSPADAAGTGPAPGLAQTVARLRALSRDVLVDCSDLTGPAQLQGILPLAVGTRLHPGTGATAAARNADRLGHLASLAGSLPLYLWGLPPRAELPADLRRRLLLASGPAIGAIDSEPPEIRPLTAAEVLAGA